MSGNERARSITAERKFARVAEAFSKDREVAIGGGKGFGAGALKVNGKIFAMISSQEQFVVKLSRGRADELAAAGTGVPFEARPGRPMKEWLVVKASNADWKKLAKEACEFVRVKKQIHKKDVRPRTLQSLIDQK